MIIILELNDSLSQSNIKNLQAANKPVENNAQEGKIIEEHGLEDNLGYKLGYQQPLSRFRRANPLREYLEIESWVNDKPNDCRVADDIEIHRHAGYAYEDILHKTYVSRCKSIFSDYLGKQMLDFEPCMACNATDFNKNCIMSTTRLLQLPRRGMRLCSQGMSYDNIEGVGDFFNAFGGTLRFGPVLAFNSYWYKFCRKLFRFQPEYCQIIKDYKTGRKNALEQDARPLPKSFNYQYICEQYKSIIIEHPNVQNCLNCSANTVGDVMEELFHCLVLSRSSSRYSHVAICIRSRYSLYYPSIPLIQSCSYKNLVDSFSYILVCQNYKNYFMQFQSSMQDIPCKQITDTVSLMLEIKLICPEIETSKNYTNFKWNSSIECVFANCILSEYPSKLAELPLSIGCNQLNFLSDFRQACNKCMPKFYVDPKYCNYIIDSLESFQSFFDEFNYEWIEEKRFLRCMKEDLPDSTYFALFNSTRSTTILTNVVANSTNTLFNVSNSTFFIDNSNLTFIANSTTPLDYRIFANLSSPINTTAKPFNIHNLRPIDIGTIATGASLGVYLIIAFIRSLLNSNSLKQALNNSILKGIGFMLGMGLCVPAGILLYCLGIDVVRADEYIQERDKEDIKESASAEKQELLEQNRIAKELDITVGNLELIESYITANNLLDKSEKSYENIKDYIIDMSQQENLNIEQYTNKLIHTASVYMRNKESNIKFDESIV